MKTKTFLSPNFWAELEKSASSSARVSSGQSQITSPHGLYGYPARFSPNFSSTAIALASEFRGRVLDPYLGSGTSVIESLRQGRSATGIDVSRISEFVVQRLIRSTSSSHLRLAMEVGTQLVEKLATGIAKGPYLTGMWPEEHGEDRDFTSLWSILEEFVYQASREKGEVGKLLRLFALSAGQASIDGKRSPEAPEVLLQRLREACQSIPRVIGFWNQSMLETWGTQTWPEQAKFIRGRAEDVLAGGIRESGEPYDMVVTSPPYPGVHVLYGKWQLRGRKETHLPALIVGDEPRAEGFYTMGNRSSRDLDYFAAAARTAAALKSSLKSDGLVIQMVGFKEPETQLAKYVDVYKKAGFQLHTQGAKGEIGIWRSVPSRKWHASQVKSEEMSKEVVLVFS